MWSIHLLEKNYNMKHLTVLFTLLLLFSCNKENNYSKRLMKGEVWTVAEIKVDGVALIPNGLSTHGKWTIIQDVSIYDTIPTLQWDHLGQEVVFKWQFQEKGKSFRLILSEEDCDGSFPTLEMEGYYLSGTYTVERKSKKEMVFTSFTTEGYTGERVEIRITR